MLTRIQRKGGAVLVPKIILYYPLLVILVTAVRSRHCRCFQSLAGQLTFTDADCWLVRSLECPLDCSCRTPPRPLIYQRHHRRYIPSPRELGWSILAARLGKLSQRVWMSSLSFPKARGTEGKMWREILATAEWLWHLSVHIDAWLASDWLHLNGLRHRPDAIGSVIYIFFFTIFKVTPVKIIIRNHYRFATVITSVSALPPNSKGTPVRDLLKRVTN